MVKQSRRALALEAQSFFDGDSIGGGFRDDGEVAVVAAIAARHLVQVFDGIPSAFRRQRHAFDPVPIYDIVKTCESHVADGDMSANVLASVLGTSFSHTYMAANTRVSMTYASEGKTQRKPLQPFTKR